MSEAMPGPNEEIPLSNEPDLLDLTALPPGHRSGFVVVVGRPNVGKSTLMNRLLGQKIAIVSHKPQTTRNRLLGVLTLDAAQVIFLDTPGIHAPKHRLGEAMVDAAAPVLSDADVLLWVVDGSVLPTDEDRHVAELLAAVDAAVPRVLALNKSDRGIPAAAAAAYAALVPGATALATLSVSALREHGLDTLLERLVSDLPEGPRYYPPDQVTDQQERFMAGELVREQLLLHLGDEVPHSVAVLVTEFKERSAEMTYISATIFVERESQKPIVLGKDGQMLKQIGRDARVQIETLLDTRVYLELWVKVRPKWRSDDLELRRLGYSPPPKPGGKGGQR
jgi:GTP-binding protein Era